MNRLSHIDEHGRARMVDVSGKQATARRAMARGELRCAAETLAAVRDNRAPKGAVIATAELAGVMGAKQTAALIPLCHPLPLDQVTVVIEAAADLPGFRITCEARTSGRTGVEMEALAGVSVAALTLFDMLKAIDRKMEIGAIAVVTKEGGRHDYDRRGDGDDA